jgi:hypothetical protein
MIGVLINGQRETEMSGRHILAGSLVAAVAGIAGLGMTGGIASAAPRAEAKTRSVRLSATAASGPTVPGNPTCDPSGRCALGYSITSTYSGDLTGQSVTNGVLYIDPATFVSQGTSLELFTGAVKGCGTGTFVVHYPLFSSGGGVITASATILSGSGTGDLAGISGTIKSEYTATANGASSQLKLQIRCHPTRSAPSETTEAES